MSIQTERRSIFDLCSGRDKVQQTNQITIMSKTRSPQEIQLHIKQLLQQKLRSNPNQVIDIITIRRPLALAEYKTHINAYFQPSVNFQYNNPIIVTDPVTQPISYPVSYPTSYPVSYPVAHPVVYQQQLPPLPQFNQRRQSMTPRKYSTTMVSGYKGTQWSTNNSSLRSSMFQVKPQVKAAGKIDQMLFPDQVRKENQQVRQIRSSSVDRDQRRQTIYDSRFANKNNPLDSLQRQMKISEQYLRNLKVLINRTCQISSQNSSYTHRS